MAHTNTEEFRHACRMEYVTGYESWIARKGKSKYAGIVRSQEEDKVAFDKVKMMVKKEVSAQLFDSPSTIKKARGIQFAVNEHSAYAHVEEFDAFSRALAATSERPIKLGDLEIQIVYASKMNHADISEFATECEQTRKLYPFSIIDERDGKNWDANVQVAHREAIADLYEDCLGKQFADYVRSGINVAGVYRDKSGRCVRYEVSGTVKSGHGDTSCGNGALNREISVQSLISIAPRFGLKRCRGLVMGDDYIAWLYFDRPVDARELCMALDEAETRLGIHPVRGLFTDLRCASFISLGFYKSVQETWIALPKVGRMFCRLFWTVTALNGRDPRRLASGIAQSFYPLYSTWKPMRHFLKYHMQVPPIDVADLCPYYNWSEVCQHRLPAPINWDENHLVKYGPLALSLDVTLSGEQGAGLAWDVAVDHLYSTDVADPGDRSGCVAAT